MSVFAPRITRSVALLFSLLLLAPVANAQEDAEQPESKEQKIPVIPDEPKTVDPARFVPEELAAEVTVEFDESSLREVGQWIQEQQKIPVLFDKEALFEKGVPLGEPVTDQLDKEPLYLLLNRLRSLGLAWYMQDDILHITTTDVAGARMSTEPYNVGDLLDAGYERDDLRRTVLDAAGGAWMELDGTGGKLEWLGDVLFVRNTDQVQREVQGLLAALRKHGRQTFTLDPPQHGRLREKLGENVTVDFDEIPLAMAVRQLAEQTGTDIRLEVRALRDIGVHERQPVTLNLSDRELATVLRVLLADLDLTWILRDGVMWVTSVRKAEEQRKAAVYDVRDLCRNQREANALNEAIQSQTKGPWFEIDGMGGRIAFARTGTMVVRHTERRLNEVGGLLATYREALRASKPRDRAEEQSREVVVRYYRMDAGMASDLTDLLPTLVEPATWKTDANPDAPGTILKIASKPGLLDAQVDTILTVSGGGRTRETKAVIAPQAVLIIRQRRAVHEKIAEVIQRVEQGDPPLAEPFGGGRGGFGGGFFSIR